MNKTMAILAWALGPGIVAVVAYIGLGCSRRPPPSQAQEAERKANFYIGEAQQRLITATLSPPLRTVAGGVTPEYYGDVWKIVWNLDALDRDPKKPLWAPPDKEVLVSLEFVWIPGKTGGQVGIIVKPGLKSMEAAEEVAKELRADAIDCVILSQVSPTPD